MPPMTSIPVWTALRAGYAGFADLAAQGPVPVSDPPSMAEAHARILVVEMLYMMYLEDPDSIGGPTDQPRATWDTMLGSTHAEYIGAGVAALWP